jgi:hypothetical protein
VWGSPKRLRTRERVEHTLERPPGPQPEAERRLRRLFLSDLMPALGEHLQGERAAEIRGTPLLIGESTAAVSTVATR